MPTPSEPAKFKVGQRVRVKNGGALFGSVGFREIDAGMVGTVGQVFDEFIRVEFADGSCFHPSYDDIELETPDA